MSTTAMAIEFGPDRTKQLELWFQNKAETLIQRASHGFFTKSIDASEIRAEFRSMADELGRNKMRLLKDWFEIRAEVFIRKTAHGWNNLTIDIEDVRKEFKVLAIEYSRMAYALESTEQDRKR